MTTTTPTQSGLLNVKECADLMRVSEKTVRRRIADGSLPAVRVGIGHGAPIRVPIADVIRHLQPTSKENR